MALGGTPSPLATRCELDGRWSDVSRVASHSCVPSACTATGVFLNFGLNKKRGFKNTHVRVKLACDRYLGERVLE